MRNPAAIAQGGGMVRFAARSAATCIALAAHIAALAALAYDPSGKPVVDEPAGPIAVEIVVAPPKRAAVAEPHQVAAAEQTLTVAAISPQPAMADQSPLLVTEREDMTASHEPAAIPTPRPKPVSRMTEPLLQPAERPMPASTSVEVTQSPAAIDNRESASSGMGNPVPASVDVPSAWKARLLSHLDRYKQYPNAARAKGMEGTALLSFGMDRNGRVLGYHLVRSSGFPELDNEAFAMIARASPLPPAPAELGAQVVQLVVPVRFRM
jgi:protein TonB